VAQIALCYAAWLSAGQRAIRAQQADANTLVQSEASCPSPFSSHDEQYSGPDVAFKHNRVIANARRGESSGR
jgi:hypothetical protein